MLDSEAVDRIKLKAHRKRLGLSLAEAAAQVEIAPRSWARYESGERRIPPSIVRLFCILNRIPQAPRKRLKRPK
jgi:transcriptional regulator with XRE-family HTH domain